MKYAVLISAAFAISGISVIVCVAEITELRKQVAEQRQMLVDCNTGAEAVIKLNDTMLEKVKSCNSSLQQFVDELKPKVAELQKQAGLSALKTSGISESLVVHGPASNNTLMIREDTRILEVNRNGNIYWYRPGKKTIHVTNQKQLTNAFIDAVRGLCPSSRYEVSGAEK